MTKIEWTDEVWNPVTGCDKVSPGCDNCYALTMAKRLKRMGQPKYQKDGDSRTSGPGFGLSLHSDVLFAPGRWRKPRRIFVNSMSDLFHPEVADGFIGDVWDVMARNPQHTFQVLTKRPQRMAELLGKWRDADWMWRRTDMSWCQIVDNQPLSNVWLGASIESDRYSFRADHLRATPAALRWISAEPLLGPLTSLDLAGIDWLVVGGESGKNARPLHPDWVRDLRDRTRDFRCPSCGASFSMPLGMTCKDHNPQLKTAFFFKQWGEWAECELDVEEVMRDQEHQVHGCQFMNNTDGGSSDHFTGGVYMRRRSKRATGRDLDDRTWNEYPIVTP